MVMKTLLDEGYLHGDCITVTGRTIAENLEKVAWNEVQDVVVRASKPLSPTGGVVGLKGNLAPDGAIVDEVFADFVFAGDAGWLSASADQADAPAPPLALAAGGGLRFSLGGLSKGAGLPQMKVGWLLAGGDPAQVAAAGERLEWIADTYLSVATPQQHALAGWLAGAGAFRAALGARLTAHRRLLAQVVVAAPGVELLPAAGGWSAVLRLPAVATDEEVAIGLLERHDVLVQPGYFYDFPPGTFLVLSLLPEPEVFATAVGRLADYLAGGVTRRPGSR
jgi:aspartate/methionine/tyrosine aminotransferase